MNYQFTSRQLTLDNLSRSHDFQKVASPKWSIFLSNFAWNTYGKSYMVFQFTPWLHLTLGGIERSNQDHWVLIWLCIIDNKATRSPEISREQVQKLTPQFLLYIYIGYRFPLSLSTIWGNHLPVNFMLKFPTCISTIWRNHLPHLTSKWRGTFQYFQSHDKMPYIYYLEKFGDS